MTWHEDIRFGMHGIMSRQRCLFIEYEGTGGHEVCKLLLSKETERSVTILQLEASLPRCRLLKLRASDARYSNVRWHMQSQREIATRYTNRCTFAVIVTLAVKILMYHWSLSAELSIFAKVSGEFHVK